MWQACNDVVVAAVAASSENELVMLELVRGLKVCIGNCSSSEPSNLL